MASNRRWRCQFRCRGSRHESAVAELFSLGHMTRSNYKEIITRDPQVRNGEPCIRSLPITVAEILSCSLEGMTIQQILAKHTELTRDDIMACAAFTADQPFGSYLC